MRRGSWRIGHPQPNDGACLTLCVFLAYRRQEATTVRNAGGNEEARGLDVRSERGDAYVLPRSLTSFGMTAARSSKQQKRKFTGLKTRHYNSHGDDSRVAAP